MRKRRMMKSLLRCPSPFSPHSSTSHSSTLSPPLFSTSSSLISNQSIVLTNILYMSTMIKKCNEKGWGGGKWFRVKNPTLSPSRSFFAQPSLFALSSSSSQPSSPTLTEPKTTSRTTKRETRPKKEDERKGEGEKLFNNVKNFSKNKRNNFDKPKGKGKEYFNIPHAKGDYNYNNNNVKGKNEGKERKEVEKINRKANENVSQKKNFSYMRFELVNDKGKGKEKEEEKIRRNIGKLINDCVEKKDIKKAEEYYQELNKLSILPSTFLLNTFLNLCRVCRYINKADEYFHSFLHLSLMYSPSPSSSSSSSSLPSLTPDLYTYNIMMDTANRCKKPAKALEYYHHMRSSGIVTPDEITFISLFKSCGLLGKTEKVAEYYQEMQLMGISPSLSLFNALIHSCVSTSDLDRAEGYYQSLLQHNLLPDCFTFTSLIKVCERSGSVDQAEVYFKHMISLDISPNLVCFNTIIDIQRSVIDRSPDSLALVMTNAQRHFKAMTEDWSISPDHFTFSSLISICALNKQLDLAEKYYEMMTREYKIRADLTVLNCLIHTASSIPSPSKAEKFFQLIKSLHLFPSRTSFNSLFQTFSSYLTRKEVEGNQQIVNNEIDLTTRQEYYKKAEEYHDQMKRLKIHADWITYKYLANISFAAGDLEKQSFYLNLK